MKTKTTNKILKHSSFFLIMALSQIIVGCGKPKVPNDNQVRALISSRMPSSAPWKLGSVTTEKIPTGDGLATVKFKAEIILNEDLFDSVDIVRGFKSVGAEPPDWPELARRIEDLEQPEKAELKKNFPLIDYESVKIIELTGQKGQEIPFYGTMELVRMVDMWSLVSFRIEKELEVSGLPREGNGQIILGSEEHKKWVAEELSKFKDFESKLVNAENAIKERKAKAAAEEARRIAEAALQKENERKQHVELYEKSCAPGSVWSGIWRLDGLSGKIAIRFIEFHNQGQVVRAQVYDPDQPNLKRELGGKLMGHDESHYGFPIRLIAPPKNGADPVLWELRQTTIGGFLDLTTSYEIALGMNGDYMEGRTVLVQRQLEKSG
jgi:hypothetical protein